MPPQKTPPTAQLSEADTRLVQAYADSQGMTLEEACTQLVRQSLATFSIQRPPSRVLTFPRKAKP